MGNCVGVCERTKCTGCGACFASCPKKAISMKTDYLGFYYPVINIKECVNCKICQHVCPSEHLVLKNKPLTCYAAESNIEVSKYSTSGGIASLLAKIWVKNGDVIYASSYDSEQQEFKFERFDRSCIDRFFKKASGSKYIQIPIHQCIKSIMEDLSRKHKIIVIGTPCQIAGLKSMFKEKDNLYLIDLLCHGVPSQKMLFDNLKTPISGLAINNILFREKKKYRLKVQGLNNEYIYNKSPFDNLFLEGFQTNLILRESCFNCIYSSFERIGDLSLGDFWGLMEDKTHTFSHPSLVMVNNVKGQFLFELLRNHISFLEKNLLEAKAGNECLNKAATPHKNRKTFLSLYSNNSFDYSVKKSRTLKKRLQHMPLLNKLVRKKYGYYK